MKIAAYFLQRAFVLLCLILNGSQVEAESLTDQQDIFIQRLLSSHERLSGFNGTLYPASAWGYVEAVKASLQYLIHMDFHPELAQDLNDLEKISRVATQYYGMNADRGVFQIWSQGVEKRYFSKASQSIEWNFKKKDGIDLLLSFLEIIKRLPVYESSAASDISYFSAADLSEFHILITSFNESFLGNKKEIKFALKAVDRVRAYSVRVGPNGGTRNRYEEKRFLKVKRTDDVIQALSSLSSALGQLRAVNSIGDALRAPASCAFALQLNQH